jgi:hypothetical protein
MGKEVSSLHLLTKSIFFIIVKSLFWVVSDYLPEHSPVDYCHDSSGNHGKLVEDGRYFPALAQAFTIGLFTVLTKATK